MTLDIDKKAACNDEKLEEYKLSDKQPTNITPCPVCGANAELWLRSKDFKRGPIDKAICCTP